jgi:hypothetical protein
MRKKIHLVLFKTQYRLAATFMRFQEHYDSPKFRGKIFSVEEFMDWYAEKNGGFSYFEDWTALNFPSKILRPFYAGRFDPLIDKEKALLNLFAKVRGRFYIIGAVENSKGFTDLLRHEFVHGLFYTATGYRRDVLNCLRGRDIADFEKSLADMRVGYHSSVFLDEINAYVLTTPDGLAAVSAEQIEELRAALREIFFRHFGYHLDEKDDGFILDEINVSHL